jgi:anti-sigma factor RsiW
MKCQACIEFILRYLEDDLSGEERTAFEFHLAKCPPCGRYVEQYRLTIEAGKTACADIAAEVGEAPEELVQAILASRRQS